MGLMKDLMIEELNNRYETEVAKEIGLTFDELTSTEYTIDEVINGDGMLYGLRVTFAKETPKEILDKIGGLKDYSVYIDNGVMDRADDYYDIQLDAISTSRDQYENFFREMVNIHELLKIKSISEKLRLILLRQIYISVIGTMETYLSDTFIWLVRENPDYLRKFVETNPEFKKRRFDLSDIFTTHDTIKDTASKVMLDQIYHDLVKVREMYRCTFEIDFPNIENLLKYVSVRHHLVHRNGKDKEGDMVNLTDELVEQLITEVSAFIKAISVQLPREDLPF